MRSNSINKSELIKRGWQEKAIECYLTCKSLTNLEEYDLKNVVDTEQKLTKLKIKWRK